MSRIYLSYACGGVAIGDVDLDGLPDVYCVSGPGSNRLYRQVSPFKFEDITEASGVAGGDRWGAGASIKDIDNDGDLDIFVWSHSLMPLHPHHENAELHLRQMRCCWTESR